MALNRLMVTVTKGSVLGKRASHHFCVALDSIFKGKFELNSATWEPGGMNCMNTCCSETSLIRPPLGPKFSGPITEVALILVVVASTLTSSAFIVNQ